MTPAQEEHLARIKADLCRLVDDKYRKGAAEHGGELLDCSLLTLVDYAIEEAIDEATYLLSLRELLLRRGPNDAS